jgi:Mg2+ and Co2+ transporter CorA
MANLEPQEIEKIIEKVVKENTISSELDYQRMLVKAGYQAYADKIKLTEGDGINYLLDQLNLNYYYALKLKNVIDNRHWSRRQTKYDSEAIATLSKDLMNIANGLFELREKVNTSLISPQLLKKNEEIERLTKELADNALDGQNKLNALLQEQQNDYDKYHKEIERLEGEIKKLQTLMNETNISYIQHESQAVQQAKQDERERVRQLLYEYFAENQPGILVKESFDIVWQALQGE